MTAATGGTSDSTLPSGRWIIALLTAIAAGGLALRILFAPGAPIHTNGHGISDIRALIYPESELYGGEELFGEAYPFIMRSLLRIMSATEESVYFLNGLFGSLSILALYGLARALRFSRGSALFAAALLALHPAHVWLSGTESAMVLFELLLLSGLAVLVTAFRRTSPVLLWVSAVFIVLAGSLRALTVAAFPIAVVIALFAAWEVPRESARRLRDHCLAAAMGVAAMLALHLNGISWVFAFSDSSIRQAQLLEGIRGTRNILLDASLTPMIVPVLALVGFIFLLWRKRPRAFLLGAAFLVAFPTGLLVNACRHNGVRYQTPACWVLYLAAGAVFSPGLLGLLREKHQKLVVAAVLLGILFGSGYGLFNFAAHDLEIAEYRFMKKAVVDLPDRQTIRLPFIEDPAGTIKPNFPDYLGEFEVVISDATATEGEVVYLGLPCYWGVRPAEEAEGNGTRGDGMRKECRDVCGKFERSPVSEATMSTQARESGYHKRFHPLGVDEVTVGFYRCTEIGQ